MIFIHSLYFTLFEVTTNIIVTTTKHIIVPSPANFIMSDGVASRDFDNGDRRSAAVLHHHGCNEDTSGNSDGRGTDSNQQ
jgi:hypothetical protein